MSTNRRPRPRPRLYYGWVIVAVVALAAFSESAESFPVLGVLLKPITEHFQWNRSVFAGATTVGTLLGGVVAVGTGPLIDRFGARWAISIAFALLGGTMVLLSGITTLWQFYVLLVLGRMLMMGVVAMAVQVVIPKWFVVKRGRATALGGLGQRIGTTITPLYVQLLVSVRSWRVAAATVGVMVWVVSLIPAAIFLRRRPEDMGLLPDGATPHQVEGHQTAASTTPGARNPHSEASLTVRQVVRLPSFYMLVTAFILTSFVGPSVNLHLIPYLTDQGLGPGRAVTVVAVWSLSSALGSLLFGFLAERYAVRLVMTAAFLLTAAALVFLLAVHSAPTALLWGLSYGLAQGPTFTLQPVILADYYGRDSLGAIRGVVWPVQMVSHSLGPLAAAIAYDIADDYVFIFALFAFLTLLAALCVSQAMPPAAAAPPGSRDSDESLADPSR